LYAASAPAEFYYAGPVAGLNRRPRSLLNGQYLPGRGVGAAAAPARQQGIFGAAGDATHVRRRQLIRAAGGAAEPLPPTAEEATAEQAAAGQQAGASGSAGSKGSPTLLSMLKKAPPGSYTEDAGRTLLLNEAARRALGEKTGGGRSAGANASDAVAPRGAAAEAGASNQPHRMDEFSALRCDGGHEGFGRKGRSSSDELGAEELGGIDEGLRQRANSGGSAGSIDDFEGEGDGFMQFAGDEMDD
jgi:hypothetical protein